jgi:membrane protein implicated in regulation of membrane protease activity
MAMSAAAGLADWAMLALAVVLGTLAATAVIAATIATAHRLTSAARRRNQCGAEGLIGHVGVVRRPLDPAGTVIVDGELWNARRSWINDDDVAPDAGEHVVVDGVQGLMLAVRRAESWEIEP